RPFQILSVLLERPGEVVTREELEKRLWPADTFVDFEHGMNTAITKLRQALSDEADNPRFIETLPRRGYRFVAPVSFGENGASLEQTGAVASADTESSSPSSRHSSAAASPLLGHFHFRSVIWIAALLFLCGLGTASWFFYVRPAPRTAWSEVRIAPLNGLPHEADVAFSPDGSQVAFVWSGDPQAHQRNHIYLS